MSSKEDKRSIVSQVQINMTCKPTCRLKLKSGQHTLIIGHRMTHNRDLPPLPLQIISNKSSRLTLSRTSPRGTNSNHRFDRLQLSKFGWELDEFATSGVDSSSERLDRVVVEIAVG